MIEVFQIQYLTVMNAYNDYIVWKHWSLTNDALRCRLVAEGMKNGPLDEKLDRSLVLVGLECGPSV